MDTGGTGATSATEILALGVGLLVLGLAGAPGADAAEPMDGATLYAQRTCIACHGPDAKTPILPEYPKLAGQNPAYTLQQMKDIKSGARANGNTPAMRGIMHLVSDEEMVVLSEYLAGLEP